MASWPRLCPPHHLGCNEVEHTSFKPVSKHVDPTDDGKDMQSLSRGKCPRHVERFLSVFFELNSPFMQCDEIRVVYSAYERPQSEAE